MNSNMIIGGIAIVAFLVVAYVVTSQRDSGEVAVTERAADEMINKEETMAAKEVSTTVSNNENPDEVMVKKDEVADDSMMKKVGSYEAYSSEKLAMANDGDVVLFFKASWCPSCRGLDANIKASAADIPAGLTILEVDYDNSAEMKQKYGVTSQHTLVQVNADGSMIKKWSGGGDLASVLSNIQ